MKKLLKESTVVLPKALLLASLSIATAAHAQIYDNLVQDPDGADQPSNFGPLYDSFTSPGALTAITGLQLALGGDGTAGTLTVGLYSDASTSPGALITTLGTFNDTSIVGYNVDTTVSLLSHPMLAPDTRYWIGLVDTGDASWAWGPDLSGPGVANEYLANQGGVFPNVGEPYMMDLVGTSHPSVPDGMSTAGVLGLAFAGLAGLRRKLA
jgi:hypothetical protein